MHRRRASRRRASAAGTSTSASRSSLKLAVRRCSTANVRKRCGQGIIKVGCRLRWPRPRRQEPGARRWIERSLSCGRSTQREVSMSLTARERNTSDRTTVIHLHGAAERLASAGPRLAAADTARADLFRSGRFPSADPRVLQPLSCPKAIPSIGVRICTAACSSAARANMDPIIRCIYSSTAVYRLT